MVFFTTKSYLIMVTWIAIINPSSRRGHEYVVAMKFKHNYKLIVVSLKGFKWDSTR